MRGAVFPLLLCGFLAISCAAKPIMQATLSRWKLFEQQDAQQHPLARPIERIPPPQTIPIPRKPYFQFDAAENSVGLLITTQDGEVVHLWVPLGKRVFTREAPILPTRPVTARITTMIHTSPKLAAPEQLDRIQCEISTYASRARGRGKDVPEKGKISFSKKDGLVRFADESASWKRWWLGGEEVESYSCS